MRLLVTGGTGFVGRHLVAARADRGDEVHVAARGRAAEPGGAALHALDATDRDATRALVHALCPDAIVHLVARTRPRAGEGPCDAARNAIGDVAASINVLEAAATAARPPRVVVRAGSIAEYGDTGSRASGEGDGATPLTPYAMGMLHATHHARRLAAEVPFALVSARLALVYGPGQSDGFLLPRLVRHCVRGRPITIGAPADRRDLIHVSDVVEAMGCLLDQAPRNLLVANVSTGRALTVGRIARLVAGATGADTSLLHVMPASRGVTLRADPGLMAERTGWVPLTPVERGIEALVAAERACAIGTAPTPILA